MLYRIYNKDKKDKFYKMSFFGLGKKIKKKKNKINLIKNIMKI